MSDNPMADQGQGSTSPNNNIANNLLGDFPLFATARQAAGGQTPALLAACADPTIRDELVALLSAMNGDMQSQTQSQANAERDLAETAMAAQRSAMEADGLRARSDELQATVNSLRDHANSLSQQAASALAAGAPTTTDGARFAATIDALQARMQAMESRALAAEVQASAHLPLAADPRNPRSGVDPEVFTGDDQDPVKRQRQYEEWKGKCVEKLNLDKDIFRTPGRRITYVGSRLGGNARHIVADRLLTVNRAIDTPALWPPGLTDYADLFTALDRTYVTVDTVDIARRHFEALQQRGKFSTFSNFVTEFQRLAWEARRSPDQMVEALKVKVTPELYKMLGATAERPRSDDVDGWIALFQRISTHIEDLKFQAKAYETHGAAGSGSSSPSSRSGMPPAKPSNDNLPPLGDMDLDAILAVAAVGAKDGTGPRLPLTVAEKERRIANNLCLYCGVGGHFARDCRRAKSASVALKKSASGKA